MNMRNTSGTPAPADWSEWRKYWRPTIKHTQFEWDFVLEVIPAVIGLQPSQVTPQQAYQGIDGREYHMDFAIVTEKVKIAIELEGFDKDKSGSGQSKKQHDKFNRKIQSLTALGWKPLTITNAQFKSDPMHYANLIRLIILESNSEKATVAKQDNSEILESIKNLSGVVRKLDSTSKDNPAITVVHSDLDLLTSIKKIGVAGITVIAALLAILIFSLTRNADSPSPPPASQATVVAAQHFDYCRDLKEVYPDGIAESQAALDKRPGSKAAVNKSVYDENVHLDGGYGNSPNGVFCD